MASLAITKDQLFGASSLVGLDTRTKLTLDQEFNFPGLAQNNAFRQALGGKGELWIFSGLLRSSAQSSLALAADNLNAILNGSTTGDPNAPAVTDGIFFFQRYQIQLKFLAADSSQFSVLYQGTGTATGIDNMVIIGGGFNLEKRYAVRDGSNFRVVQPFNMAMRRLT